MDTARSPKLRRWVMVVGLSVLAFPALPALALLAEAETWRGHVAGAACLTLVIALWLLPRRTRAAAAVAATSLALVLTVYALPPPALASATASSIFLAGERDDAALAAVVPEVDQLVAGLRVLPFAGALSFDEAREARAVLVPIYHALAGDPQLSGLGSELHQSYAQLSGSKFDVGHYFRVTPPRNQDELRPAVIFLHGAMGNALAYVWALAPLAAERGFVVAHPSFGVGRWDGPGGVEAVERVRRHLIETASVDPDRIYLVGLSNGGLGASRAAAAHPDAYRGVAFISPVFDQAALESSAFVDGWRGRRVLALTGSDDARVSETYVGLTMASVGLRGAAITMEAFEGESHLLLVTARDRVLDALADWMEH